MLKTIKIYNKYIKPLGLLPKYINVILKINFETQEQCLHLNIPT